MLAFAYIFETKNGSDMRFVPKLFFSKNELKNVHFFSLKVIVLGIPYMDNQFAPPCSGCFRII